MANVNFFFFNDTATTEIYTLSLHDALPIWSRAAASPVPTVSPSRVKCSAGRSVKTGQQYSSGTTISSLSPPRLACRSEEHTSELQSPCNLVCRLLLEKKKTHCHAVCMLRHA